MVLEARMLFLTKQLNLTCYYTVVDVVMEDGLPVEYNVNQDNLQAY